MKSISTLLLFTLSLSLSAQTPIEVSMGPGYTSDVFVSLDGGEVATVDATTWHLAFDVRSSFSNAIRINDGHGVELSVYPNTDIEGWDTADSSGWSTWARLNNLIDTWDNGAFNISPAGGLDFSWGYYTGDPLHDVVGDSLYVVGLPDGSAKKLRIDVLDSGNWTFTYANLDGSDETEVNMAMADYTGKNFLYYDLINGAWIDREPASADWDIVFTRYYGPTAFGFGGTSGALANINVPMIKAEGDPGSVNYVDFTWETERIDVMNNEWRFLNSGFMWEITSDLSYFCQDQNGDVYHILFTGFGGTDNGDISYNISLFSAASVAEQGQDLDLLVYPNPTSNQPWNVVWTSDRTQTLQLQLADATGKVISSEQVNTFPGENRIELDAQDLPDGFYFLNLTSDSQRATRTLVVQH